MMWKRFISWLCPTIGPHIVPPWGVFVIEDEHGRELALNLILPLRYQKYSYFWRREAWGNAAIGWVKGTGFFLYWAEDRNADL